MLEKYHFTRSNGEKVAVHRPLDILSLDKIQKLQKQYKDDGAQMTRKMMEAALGKETTDEIFCDWSARDAQNFMQGWTESDGNDEVDLGKSSGSQES